MGEFSFYLDKDLFDISRLEDKNFKSYFNQVKVAIDVAEQLKANIYYQTDHFGELNDVIKEFKSEFNRSQGDKLQILLENSLPNRSNLNSFIVNFNYDQSNISNSNIQSVHTDDVNSTIIFITYNSNRKDEILFIDTGNRQFYKVEINFMSTPQQIWGLICSLQSRKFSDLKHGDDKKPSFGFNKGKFVSQLKCDSKRAQELLDSAICDLNKSPNLFNYDQNLGTFVEFFDEKSLNQFHGFHLEKHHWNRVPNKVAKYFGK